MALVTTDNVVLLFTRKLGLCQLCKPHGLALYIPDENTTNAIKGSASQILDLRHSLVVKLGAEMEDRTEGKRGNSIAQKHISLTQLLCESFNKEAYKVMTITWSSLIFS